MQDSFPPFPRFLHLKKTNIGEWGVNYFLWKTVAGKSVTDIKDFCDFCISSMINWIKSYKSLKSVTDFETTRYKNNFLFIITKIPRAKLIVSPFCTKTLLVVIKARDDGGAKFINGDAWLFISQEDFLLGMFKFCKWIF